MSVEQPEHSPSLRLMFAEDEFMVAWTLIEMAKSLGHQVCGIARTEREALEAVVQLNPDVVFLDYRLADGGNGLHVASLIREAKEVPIVFCSAYGESLRRELMGLARVHLIVKPVSIHALRQALAWAANALRSQHLAL